MAGVSIRQLEDRLRERLAAMEAAGEITLPRGKKKRRARIQPARVRGRPVAETLLEDRG